MKKITKTENNISFNVDGSYSESWFSNNKINTWEQDTFRILEKYKNKNNGTYIDIGAWIGPTVLYAANFYNEVIALEPDPVAITLLEKNLLVNNFSNITLIKKGLSNKIAKAQFGGNGPLGNSESTLLVSESGFLKENWGNGKRCYGRNSNIVEIETITMEQLVLEQHINTQEISLIKMDIEGGELLVIPYLQNFLRVHKPTFYVSLHYVFLNLDHIESLLNILFSIYDNCYVFDKNDISKKTSIDDIIKNKFKALVFDG